MTIRYRSCAALRRSIQAGVLAAVAFFALGTFTPPALADEGGVSFWLPGQYASLAATPAQPGWSFAALYYHMAVDANAAKNFRIGGGIQAGLKADGNLGLLSGTYVWKNPVLGGQFAFGIAAIGGRTSGTVAATLTGPFGNSISGSRTDDITGFGDLYPTASLRWNFGVHNLMVYTAAGLPVGAYSPTRLANMGIGHYSWDNGFGYTYFDPVAGWEASAVLGFTYNFVNPYTDYQNGVDFHLDWGVSRFVTKQLQIGFAGYFYSQLTGDSGSGATLGDFKSRVNGIGPQIGYLFPVGDMQGYLNLRGYREFGAENRAEGWNILLTFALSPAARTEHP